MEQKDADTLKKDSYQEGEVEVDQVLTGAVLDDALMAQLAAMGDGASLEFGESNDKEHEMDAVRADALEAERSMGEESTAPTATVPTGPTATTATAGPQADDGMVGPFHSPGERAAHLIGTMKDAVVKWFSDNKVAIIAGLVAGIAGVILANIVTGGAIMAALPLLMQIVSAYFAAEAVYQVAKHFGGFLGAAWPGNLVEGATKLARGLAVLTIELVFALLFGAKAAFRGTKTAVRTVAKQGVRGATRTGAKAIATGARQGVRNTAKAVKDLGTVGRNGVRAIANNGKVAMKGVRKGFARGAKTFDDLGQRLAKKFRFRKFRIRVRKRRFKLEGEINPWVLLASGEVRKVALEDIGSAKVGDKIKIDGADATILADGRYITPGKKFKDHFIRHKGLLENILGKKYPKYKTHGAEFLSDVGKVIEDGTVSMVGRGTLKKGQPVLNIFRGKGLTIATKPDGEFVTILETGKGMDLGIQFIP